MARRAVGMGLGVLAAIAAFNGCQQLKVAHSGDNPRYELIGKHQSVPCEACHGAGKPEAQSRLCMDCHTDALPNAQHYPGEECGLCHTPLGWEVVDTTIPPDTSTDTGDTDTGELPTGWVHETVGLTELCWDCHDDERPSGHYWNIDELVRWDCASCHTLLTWTDDPRTPAVDPTPTTYVHPARTPHGTRNNLNPTPMNEWVISCDSCHPAVLTQFDCVNCHLARDSSLFPHYNASNEDCLGCHPDGDYIFVPQ